MSKIWFGRLGRPEDTKRRKKKRQGGGGLILITDHDYTVQSNRSDVRAPCAMCPLFGDWINLPTDFNKSGILQNKK